MKNKILILTSEFPPGPGGIANHAWNLTNYLSQHDYEVKVVTEQRDEFAVDLQLVNVFYLVRGKFLIYTYFKRILFSLKYASKSDLIIVSGKFYLWVAGFIKLIFRKKSIAIVHGSELDLKQITLHSLTNISLRNLDGVIAVSKYTADHLPEILANRKQIRGIIHNGILFKNQEKVIKCNPLSRKQPKLLTVGKISERKGQINMLRALPLLVKIYPEIRYDIVGIDDEKNILLPLIDSLQLNEIVTIHGIVSDEQLNHFYSEADLFIMLSTHTAAGDFEGFGIAILEANAQGVPAIGTLHSGIADAIINGVTGELVNEKDPDEIKNAVVKILNNYSSYSQEALSWAAKHDWNEIGKQYVEVIQSVLNSDS